MLKSIITMKDKSIKERKELGLTSAREQLHRKVYLIQDEVRVNELEQTPYVSVLTQHVAKDFNTRLTWDGLISKLSKNRIERIIVTDTEEEAAFERQLQEIKEDVDLRVKIASAGHRGIKKKYMQSIGRWGYNCELRWWWLLFSKWISHVVKILTSQENPGYELAGAQELPVYFLNDQSFGYPSQDKIWRAQDHLHIRNPY